MQYLLKKQVIKKILNPYEDAFIYLQSDNITYESESTTLCGQITYQGSHFLKNALDHKIFNSGDAILAINQIGLVLLLLKNTLSQKQNLNNEELEKIIIKNIDFVWNVVVMSQTIAYKKMIPTNLDVFSFEAKIKAFRKSKKGEFFILDIILGPNNNFMGSCTGIVLKENVH